MDNKLIPKDSDILTDISSKLSEYLEVKDIILEDDFFETFGDTFKVVKLFRNGYDLIAKRKFKAFLKGFSNEENTTEEQLNKLAKYIDSTKKAEFIADMFSKVLMSNSKLACMIMGIMINDLTINDKDITHGQLICANSLTSFFDDDVINFFHIINFSHDLILKRHNSTRVGFYEYNFNKFLKDGYYDANSMNMTLHKAIAYQLFLSDYEVDASFDSDDIESSTVETDIFFRLTKAGELLYTYISKISSYLK